MPVSEALAQVQSYSEVNVFPTLLNFSLKNTFSKRVSSGSHKTTVLVAKCVVCVFH